MGGRGPRTMRRIPIAALMAAVLFCAIAVAAIRNASDTWAGVLLLLTLGTLAAAPLGVAYRRDARRAWWLGFALFGWGYARLSLDPSSTEESRSRLPTTALMDLLLEGGGPVVGTRPDPPAPPAEYLKAAGRLIDSGHLQLAASYLRAADDYSDMLSQAERGNLDANIARLVRAEPTLTWARSRRLAVWPAPLKVDPDRFKRVGHSLFAVLAGLVGGAVARWFHAGQRRAESRGGE
jgi:hypothetical protein